MKRDATYYQMTDLLKITGLGVRFRALSPLAALLQREADPWIDAVLDVSLDVAPGETVALVGESGSGKTTLGRSILGLVRPQTGSIEFEGAELCGLSEAAYKPVRRNIAMMFQDPVASLSRRRSVRAQISEPYKVHDMPADDDETDSLMELVGLNRSFRNRFPHELSGGQARRVGVARALTLSPKLIIADEPTAGLDVSVQGEILNLMRDLQQKLGISYLIVTHNLPVVQHVSDRIAVMYLGRLLEQGDTRSIFKRPAHPYTRVLLDAVPQPDPAKRRELTSIEGEVPSLRERPAGCEFHPRCVHKQERCSWDSPESQSLADGRLVRCHFPLALG